MSTINTGVSSLYSAANSVSTKRTSGADNAKFKEILEQAAATTTSGTASTSGSTSATGTSQYDFTNVTKQQALDTANSLYKAGKLTLDEAGILITSGPIARVDGSPIPADTSYNLLTSLQGTIDGLKEHHQPSTQISAYEVLLSKVKSLQGQTFNVNQYA